MMDDFRRGEDVLEILESRCFSQGEGEGALRSPYLLLSFRDDCGIGMTFFRVAAAGILK